MDWKRGPPPEKFIGQPIIIAAKPDKDSKSYWYNVVFWYDKMEAWYGGPGIRVRNENIEYWSEIPSITP
jgi:hypothetical protein